MADLRVMGSDDPAREGSVSSFALRILITWMRKKMLRVITTITGTARNKVDDLKMSLSCLFAYLTKGGLTPNKVGQTNHLTRRFLRLIIV